MDDNFIVDSCMKYETTSMLRWGCTDAYSHSSPQEVGCRVDCVFVFLQIAPFPTRGPGPPDPVQLDGALPLLQETLEHLGKGDLKKFISRLRERRTASHDPIPWSQLENKDTTDLADVMLRHYGGHAALQAVLQILPDIPRRELIPDLEQKMGKEI